MALVWGWAAALVGCWPSSAQTTTGEVRVEYRSPVVVEKDTVWGAYLPRQRTIVIDEKLPYSARIHFIEHERCHAVLNDEDVVLDSLQEERVCEAWAKWHRHRRQR